MKHFVPGTKLLFLVQTSGDGVLTVVDGDRYIDVPVVGRKDGRVNVVNVEHVVRHGDVDILASPTPCVYLNPNTVKPYEHENNATFRVLGMQIGMIGEEE